jgi:predicted acylesterase/phospholipase RssA
MDDPNNLIEQAWRMLRAPGGDPAALLKLAERLKSCNRFGVARRLLQRALEDQSVKLAPALRLKIAQVLTLCTYKDPDLPLHEALDRAFRILELYDPPGQSTDQETLGLAGAIYKRKWQQTTAKQHLEQSLAYYLRAYHHRPANDDGYTGINAAYILDLLAHLEERNAAGVGGVSESARARRNEARAIREALVAQLSKLPDQVNLGNQWWFVATIAEAHFGLRQYGNADQWLKRIQTINPPQWELETTARQLAHLAELQLGAGEDVSGTEAWRVVAKLLGGDAEAARSVFFGKFGLALSGGGFRASLFHIGVLARLAELDLLRHVHVLSCVSGGSIVGAFYYLEVRELLRQKDDQATKADYVAIVQRMADKFFAGVQQNLRMRMVGSLRSNLQMIFSGTYSRTLKLGELYEQLLYARVADDKKRHLNELFVAPGGKACEPKRDNWRRKNKVPILVLNATTLNTGHNWQYTASWMGESPYAIDTEVDGNWRLRRMYHHAAPSSWKEVSLGQAVGASACVPGLFEPIVMTGLYPKEMSPYPEMTVRLVDGGVHDNQGIASLLEQDCSVLIVSDASGQIASDAAPSGGVFGPLLRTNSILMERVRQAQFQDLKARQRAGLLKGLAILHLKKGLDTPPVDWKTCEEPADTPLQRASDLVPYGILREMQKRLSAIRTDLDSFSQIEAHALMTSGYLMAETYASELGGYSTPKVPRGDWAFLALESPLASVKDRNHDKVKEHLGVASQKGFKIWRLSKRLRITSQVLMVAAVIAFAALCWMAPDTILVASPVVGWSFTVGNLGTTALCTVLGVWLGRKVADLLQIRQTLRRIAAGIGLAVVGGLAAQIHLRFFDQLFRRSGQLHREPAQPHDDEPITT